MREYYTFDDVLIAPKFSYINSRKDVDLTVNVEGLPGMGLPVISSNMKTITECGMAKAMLLYGAQACLHRFWSIDENVKALQDSKVSVPMIGVTFHPMVSTGIGALELERAEALISAGAKYIVIDVAHGAQQQVVDHVKSILETYKNNISVIVGNFANAVSIHTFMNNLGSNGKVAAWKVGIGPGSVCTTRIKTGVGIPQLSAIQDCANLFTQNIIADGGMKTPGDIAKALAVGAKAVMLGGMLAGTDETPGEGMLTNNKGRCKLYTGSAHRNSTENESYRTSEGETVLVPCKGPVIDILSDIEGGLRSSLAYAGASNLKEFMPELIRVSSNTIAENGAHGKN